MRVRKHGVARVACLSRINTITPHGSLLPYMQMRETGGPTTGAAVSPRPPSFLRRRRRVSVSASRRGRRSALIGLRMGNDVGGDVTRAIELHRDRALLLRSMRRPFQRFLFRVSERMRRDKKRVLCHSGQTALQACPVPRTYVCMWAYVYDRVTRLRDTKATLRQRDRGSSSIITGAFLCDALDTRTWLETGSGL